MPIRTVLITALSKFDGARSRRLRAREFHQIAGRAGRAGFDTAGTVVVQAPEHDIENARLLAKAQAKFGDDTKRINQSLSSKRKKAPEGFVGWSEKTFDQLVEAAPGAANLFLRHHPFDAAEPDAPPGEPGHCRVPHHPAEPREPRAPPRAAAQGNRHLQGAADRWRD